MWGQPRLSLRDEHQRVLRDLQIDATGPGTILHDFGALLSFVRQRKLRVSKVNRLLPRTSLPKINALLAHPIEMRLQRPQLKSYPHVQGLYLLLRATGLGLVAGSSSSPTLVIDPQAYDAWGALNHAEQYFTLLETWLLRASSEIIGERDSFLDFPLVLGTDLIARAGREGVAVAGESQIGLAWHDASGLMSLALMEMFGFVSVAVRPPQEREGWVVDRVYATPLGEAMYALLSTELLGDLDQLLGMIDADQVQPGALQPILAPYVPQWRRSLTLPSWSFREGRYVFRVALHRGLWRRIAIDAAEPLDALAGAILDAYDFDQDHLYEFRYRDRFGMKASVQHPFIDESPWTSEVRVGDVPLAVGQVMTFLFDFGDQWEFEVKLEAIASSGTAACGPTMIEARGEAPEQYPDWGDGEW